ncbi:unnamed protein product, partial [Mesorhabditis spiculigera]
MHAVRLGIDPAIPRRRRRTRRALLVESFAALHIHTRPSSKSTRKFRPFQRLLPRIQPPPACSISFPTQAPRLRIDITTKIRLTDSRTRSQTFRPTQHRGVRVLCRPDQSARGLQQLLRPVLRRTPLFQVLRLRDQQECRRPCENLQQDFRCGIHTGLRKKGFTGCTVYDCFGAGQKVSQQTYDGISWRDAPGDRVRHVRNVPCRTPVARTALVSRRSPLAEANPLDTKGTRRCTRRTESLTNGTPSQIQAVDVSAHRATVNTLLLQTSDLFQINAAVGDSVYHTPDSLTCPSHWA